MTHDFLIVLPARYESARLRGKPLADICGKPMVVMAYENIKAQARSDLVIVATDDDRIREVCIDRGIPCEMTNPNHKTGTDRVAEVSNRFPEFQYVINAQPDEPLMAKGVIDRVKNCLINNNLPCCGMAPIIDSNDILNPNVGKVVVDRFGFALYISRAPIPCRGKAFFTQVCVYGFPRHYLMQYYGWKRGVLERIEEIELLRFIENHVPLQMVTVPGERLSVDTPEDLEKVRRIVENAAA